MRYLPTLLLLLATAASAPSYRYQLDGANSQVSARVSYFGIRQKIARFPVRHGAIRLSPDRLDSIDLDVELDAQAMTAGSRTDTEYLKGKAFFDVAHYPAVTFSGHRMTMTGATNALIDGQITARGITRPATLTVAFRDPPARATGREPIQITATTQINRRDFGMTSYGWVVGKTVTITIQARMVPE